MRRCIGICHKFRHVKSLRWVGTRKREYKYCYKCCLYFRAPAIQIQCECCKDTLRVYYKLPNSPRRKRLFKATIYYLLNQSDILIKRLIHHEFNREKYLKRFRSLNPIKKRHYNSKYYKTHNKQIRKRKQERYYDNKAKSINRINLLN